MTDSVTVDSSGFYQFTKYPEKIIEDDFDNGSGGRTCANGTDGDSPWATDWVDAGDPSAGFCNNSQAAVDTDADIFKAQFYKLCNTKSEKDDLEKTVDVASTFSASNIQVTSVDEKKNGKEKSTTKAKNVDKLVVSFDVENRIAKSGAADMYLIVTAPDGKVIAEQGSSTLNTREDGDKAFTAKVPVEYVQGKRQNIQFPIHQSGFLTGNYKIEIYHNGFKIGEGVRSLKKGGLFS